MCIRTEKVAMGFDLLQPSIITFHHHQQQQQQFIRENQNKQNTMLSTTSYYHSFAAYKNTRTKTSHFTQF